MPPTNVAAQCVAPQPLPPAAEFSFLAARKYLSRVYPSGASSIADLSNDAVRSLFASRQWFYDDSGSMHGNHRRAPLPESIKSQLIRSDQHQCDDGFFGSGLLQRDAPSRFPGILPCFPGGDCIRRQTAHLPECAPSLKARGRDVWLEVWHLAYDGRHRPRHRPRGWSDFLDHGQSGWWYIHAPGSGIFYHAGRTLAAPSKAALLAALLEEWSAKGGGGGGGGGGRGGGKRHAAKSSAGVSGVSGVSGISGGVSGVSGSTSLQVDKEALSLIKRFTGGTPHDVTWRLHKLMQGVPCANVSWGRWRCIGDAIPNDTWDPLLLTLGRVLGYDSLMLTALTWGRTIGSAQRLLALAQVIIIHKVG